MTLYNLHGDGPYTISKFTRDGTLESTYELSTDGRTCTCPAGHRHSCRHRDMLGNLRPLANTPWFWDYSRGMAVDFNSVPKAYYDSVATPAMIPQDQPVSKGLRVDSDGYEVPEGIELEDEDADAEATELTDLQRWDRIINRPHELRDRPHSTTVSAPDFDSGDGGSNPPAVAKPWRRL